MYKQINFELWDEIASPEFIAILPYFVEEFENTFKLEFEHHDQCDYAFVEINGIYYCLSSYPGEDETKRYIGVEVRSFEANSEFALELFLRNFKIKKNDLIWHSKLLGRRKWIVKKIDENGNEEELFRFLNQESANWFSYKNKGTIIVEE